MIEKMSISLVYIFKKKTKIVFSSLIANPINVNGNPMVKHLFTENE